MNKNLEPKKETLKILINKLTDVDISNDINEGKILYNNLTSGITDYNALYEYMERMKRKYSCVNIIYNSVRCPLRIMQNNSNNTIIIYDKSTLLEQISILEIFRNFKKSVDDTKTKEELFSIFLNMISSNINGINL